MDAKAIVDRSGVGCEPASATSVAGARKLKEEGVIHKDDSVVCILTGNLLKDPDATIQYHMKKLQGIKTRFSNKPVVLEPDSTTILQNIKKVVASII